MNYKVVEGSETGHCCFEWSVIPQADEGSNEIVSDYPVCECYEKEDAERIAKLLNEQGKK